MKSFSCYKKLDGGSVIIEFLFGFLCWSLISIGSMQLLRDWWGKAFAQTEAFYISRALLYGNNVNCKASNIVDSAIILPRHYFCSDSYTKLKLYLSTHTFESNYSLGKR